MSRVNGAKLLARTLRLAGTGPVFTLSGHQILPIYDAGIDEQLRFVDTRHESAAGHMADAWARLTGRPGVFLVTASPGHTNSMTGLATAWASESPVLLLSGGTEVAHVGRGGFQELDQVTMAGPVTKGAWMVTSPTTLPMLIAKALRTALEGTPGPVHVTLPWDILNHLVDESDVVMPTAADFEPKRERADDEAIRRAIALLAQAKRPIVLGGPSAWRGLAGERLRELLKETGVPALRIDSAVGLAEPSLHGLTRELKRCDLALLATPQDFAIGFAGTATLGTGCTIVQIAPRKEEIGRNRAVDLGLVGDAASVLGQLSGAARGRAWRAGEWRDELEAIRQTNLARARDSERSDEVPLHPHRVVSAVRELLRPGDCVALDGGDFVRWARWAFGGGQFELLTNGKLGGLGPGIPFAMTAALARSEVRSVAFVGDGTFGFHGMELDTAVRHNLPFVVVVGNDAAWSTEKHHQLELYGADRLVAAELLPTRYDRVAEALGAHGEHVERPEQLAPALERAFASGRPACVNVAIASVRSPSPPEAGIQVEMDA